MVVLFTIDSKPYISSCGLVILTRHLQSRRIRRFHHLKTLMCSRHTIRTSMSLAIQQSVKMKTDLTKEFDSLSRLNLSIAEIYKQVCSSHSVSCWGYKKKLNSNYPRVYCESTLPLISDIGAYVNRDRFPFLSEEDQSAAFSIMGRLSCAWANTLSGSTVPTRGQVHNQECSICDIAMEPRRTSIAEHPDMNGLVTTVENLIESTQKAKSRRSRIAALLATRRLLAHSANVDRLDLSKSGLGQWCLKYLRSSLRDLRIAAG